MRRDVSPQADGRVLQILTFESSDELSDWQKTFPRELSEHEERKAVWLSENQVCLGTFPKTLSPPPASGVATAPVAGPLPRRK